jgi:hypothetical protein
MKVCSGIYAKRLTTRPSVLTRWTKERLSIIQCIDVYGQRIRGNLPGSRSFRRTKTNAVGHFSTRQQKKSVEITRDQMHHFVGNMFQVFSRENEPFLVMSSRAYKHLHLHSEEPFVRSTNSSTHHWIP